MPLIPLQFPPGMYANGTDLEAAGRWRDGNLVRWVNGSLRPVGGWRLRKETAFAAPVRGLIAWEDNSGDRWVAAGTYNKLYVMSASNTVSDITPGSFTSGNADATINFGYGGSFYGTGYYGAPRPDTGNYAEATTWAVDTWGQYLVACSVSDGKLYEWQLNTASAAAAISGAPTGNLSLVTTEERFLFALGAGGNPRKVQWCDREDNTTWTPAATNEAGDIELQTAGQIMRGLRTRGQTFILTDQDAHTATYVGPPFVYGFERVGTSCGLAARLAAASTDYGVFWMGQRSFFHYDGSTVSELKCEVLDRVFGDINASQFTKANAVVNGQFGEVWWFYPSAASNECDKYVAFNYKEGWWHTGEIDRTAGIDRGVFKYPFWVSSTGNVYEHEIGLNFDSSAIYAETGPISLGAGDNVMACTRLIPDEETQGEVTATFKARFHPNDTERSYGPFTMSNPTSVRFTGRQVRMRVDGVALKDFRVGVMRLEAQPGGRR